MIYEESVKFVSADLLFMHSLYSHTHCIMQKHTIIIIIVIIERIYSYNHLSLPCRILLWASTLQNQPPSDLKSGLHIYTMIMSILF